MGSIVQINKNARGSCATDVLILIANYCGRAEHNGFGWKCNCPICHRHSLCITPGHKVPVLIQCWHCEACGINDGHTEQRSLFIDAGLLEPDQRAIKKLTKQEYEQYCANKREAAVGLWARLKPLTSDRAAANYLRARGLGSFIYYPALRYADQAFNSIAQAWRPILAARMFHVEHGICAVQETYLQRDGSDRDRELTPGRQTFGHAKGGAVWIGAPKPDEECVIAEGLETCLSAMLLFKLKCGAAILSPNLKEVALPSAARLIHIAADNDETGRGAAAHAACHWRVGGRRVRVSAPERENDDFNDVLMRREGIRQ